MDLSLQYSSYNGRTIINTSLKAAESGADDVFVGA